MMTDPVVTDDLVERVARAIAEASDYDLNYMVCKKYARAALAASDRVVLVAENARLREALTYAKEYLCGECNVGALAEIQAIERIDAALVSLDEELCNNRAASAR